MDILKKYVCSVPFEYLEVHSENVYACCPEWLTTPIVPINEVSTAWKSEMLKKIQESVINGTYEYCSSELCPALNELITKGTNTTGMLIPKNKFKNNNSESPNIINYSFDRSCNLSCPSCRTEKIMADETELDKIQYVINEIEESYGEKLHGIYLSGTADPFASKSFRKLLTDFDKTKYPKLHKIALHTNGLLFTKEMWNKIKKSQKHIKSVEISVDAATKETYEIIRRGGDWDILIENLKFIGTLPLFGLKISMVVQNTNYMEMEDFYNMVRNLLGDKTQVFFRRIVNWNTFTNDEFKEKEVFNEEHPEFNLFLLQLLKIDKKYNCIHNFHDVVEKHIKKELKFI